MILGRIAFILAALVLWDSDASGQVWPARPIKLIVSTGPGTSVDGAARLLSSHLSRSLNQQVFVENLPGGAGVVGAQAAARAAPDGYTLFFATQSVLASNHSLYKSIPYDSIRDFTPVAMVADSSPYVFTVISDLPVRTMPELIALAKSQPGKLSYAVDASSGLQIIAGQLLNKRAGIEMLQIPYRSTAQALQDVATGRIQIIISAPGAVEGFVSSGTLRRIAISSKRRFPGLEDLPTIAETLPDYYIDGWFLIAAPAGTSSDIVQRVNQEVDIALKDAELKERFRMIGLGTSGASTPQSITALIRTERERWRDIVQELNIQPQ